MVVRRVSNRYDRVKIVKSRRSGKKYDAVFAMTGTTKTKRISFGAAGMSDFTKHKDKARKQRYLLRHARREAWTNPYTAGTLSRYILWNKPSLSASIASYRKRFRLKG